MSGESVSRHVELNRRHHCRPVLAGALVLVASFVLFACGNSTTTPSPTAALSTTTPLLANGPIIGMPGQPPGGFIVSLNDSHYLNIELALQSTNVTDSSELSADTPELLKAVVSVFGGMGYSYLQDAANQPAEKAAILQDFQQILGKKDGLPQVSAVYFTNFQLQ